MSGTAMKWARRQQVGDAVLVSVLRRICELADERGTCWASQPTLAAGCGLSERTVRRALALLQQFGVLARTRRSRGFMGRNTDLIRLALHRDFVLTAAAVRKERARAAPGNSQPDARSSATGRSVRGITKGTTYPPSQEGEASSYVEGSRTHSERGTAAATALASAVVLPFRRRGAA